MKCIFASEVASLVGANRFTSPEEAWEKVVARHNKQKPEYNEVEELERQEFNTVCNNRIAARAMLTRNTVQDVLGARTVPCDTSTTTKEELLDSIYQGKTVEVSPTVLASVLEEFPDDAVLTRNTVLDTRTVPCDTTTKEELLDSIYQGKTVEVSPAVLEEFPDDNTNTLDDTTDPIAALCAVQSARRDAMNKPHLIKEYGCFMESQQLAGRDKQVTLSRALSDEWIIYGRADSIENGSVVEIKNRMNKIYNQMFENDKIQLSTYMWMAELDQGILEQHCKGEKRCTPLAYDSEWYESILEELREFISKQ
jgi:hypothetical protein